MATTDRIGFIGLGIMGKPIHHKDLGIVLSLARATNTPLPVAALVDQMFASLEANERGDLDPSALLMYLEDLAAHE
jgi:3-hydroxyisobutyrate dehydrogenase-like beta-hydroxyacid dehydrogenase